MTTKVDAAIPASWDATAYKATLNEVGGHINVDVTVEDPIAAGATESVIITNSKVTADSRVHVTMSYQTNGMVFVAGVSVAAGAFTVQLHNVAAVDADAYVGFHFDVINPA